MISDGHIKLWPPVLSIILKAECATPPLKIYNLLLQPFCFIDETGKLGDAFLGLGCLPEVPPGEIPR